MHSARRTLRVLVRILALRLPAMTTQPVLALARDGPRVVLVRHAEKAFAAGSDPPLSPAGSARAMALAESLKEMGITAILITQFQRTLLTAQPLAERLRLTPEVVALTRAGLAVHVQAVAAAVVRQHGGAVLVVGHSNTLPGIITALGGPAVAEISESEFSRLFVLLPGETGPRLLRSHYGAT